MANRWINLSDSDIDLIKGTLGNGKTAQAVVKKLTKAQQRIKISSAKGKGRDLQMWVCERIAKLLNLPFDNQDDQCLIHCREMGQSGTDVVLRGEAAKRFPFSTECKSTEQMSIQAFVSQARANTKPDQMMLIVYRCKMLRDPVVIIDWETFEYLFRKGV